TLQEAARVLRLSVRQVRRIRRAVERAGRAGLCHGNAGQVPVNKLRAAVRTRILRLRRTKYRDFNDAHFTEKLAEEQPPLRISVRTVRRVLLAGGHFVDQECAAGYLRVLRAVVAAHGVPWSIYMDQHGALQRNDDHWTPAEELRGKQDPTQVGQALEALAIEAIYALSPQAK